MKNAHGFHNVTAALIHHLREEGGPTIDWCDNKRHGWMDNPKSMEEYYKKKMKGCCGFLDVEVTIQGRQCMVGCNYGH